VCSSDLATFDTAKQICESDVIYIPTYEHTDQEWEEIHQKYLSIPQPYAKVLTREECLKYEQGWKYFQQYYFSLWD
jgi:hypothetical protein